MYKRLSNALDRQEIDAIATELVDRFGSLPEEVDNLLTVVEMKQLCRIANIGKFVAGSKGAVITFHNNDFSNPAGLIDYITEQRGEVKLRHDQKLIVTKAWHVGEKYIRGIFDVLNKLAEINIQK